jgi:hypothetical protein
MCSCGRLLHLLRMSLGVAVLVSMASPARAAADSTPAFPGPANFVDKIDNAFFPLVPGTTFVYDGTKDGDPERDVFYVTHRTRDVLGVQTTVVHDRGFLKGVLEEETHDYFAQDKQGNVWYFGEDTQELDATGHVISTEGTWLAGRNGAMPGIIMEAHPVVGNTYRQEFAPPLAEDMATVLSLKANVSVPFARFANALETRDFSPLEPGTVEHKFYARGVGDILEVAVKGGRERLELVAIHRPDDDNDGADAD